MITTLITNGRGKGVPKGKSSKITQELKNLEEDWKLEYPNEIDRLVDEIKKFQHDFWGIMTFNAGGYPTNFEELGYELHKTSSLEDKNIYFSNSAGKIYFHHKQKLYEVGTAVLRKDGIYQSDKNIFTKDGTKSVRNQGPTFWKLSRGEAYNIPMKVVAWCSSGYEASKAIMYN